MPETYLKEMREFLKDFDVRNLSDRTKKWNSYVLTFIFISCFVGWTEQKRWKLDSFSSCTVTEISLGRRGKTTYRYTIGCQTYIGRMSSRRRNNVKINGQYVLVYESENPANNSALLTMKFKGQAQLDSLTNCCDPAATIGFWNFDSNNSDLAN